MKQADLDLLLELGLVQEVVRVRGHAVFELTPDGRVLLDNSLKQEPNNEEVPSVREDASQLDATVQASNMRRS